MACPKCGSEEWKLASVVYAEGIHNLSATTNFVGGGLGDDILGVGVGVGVGRGKTSGTQQTRLSELAAPPIKPPPPAKIRSSKKPSIKPTMIWFAAVVAIIIISESIGFNPNILPTDVKIMLFMAGMLPGLFIGIKLFLDLQDSNVDKQNKIALNKHEEMYQLALQEYANKRMCLRCSEFYFEEIGPEFSNQPTPHVAAPVINLISVHPETPV